jgi:hypothetical protein
MGHGGYILKVMQIISSPFCRVSNLSLTVHEKAERFGQEKVSERF